METANAPGELQDVHQGDRSIGGLPGLRLATPATPERDVALGDPHPDL